VAALYPSGYTAQTIEPHQSSVAQPLAAGCRVSSLGLPEHNVAPSRLGSAASAWPKRLGRRLHGPFISRVPRISRQKHVSRTTTTWHDVKSQESGVPHVVSILNQLLGERGGPLKVRQLRAEVSEVVKAALTESHSCGLNGRTAASSAITRTSPSSLGVRTIDSKSGFRGLRTTFVWRHDPSSAVSFSLAYTFSV
jgi:hypothetical protein